MQVITRERSTSFVKLANNRGFSKPDMNSTFSTYLNNSSSIKPNFFGPANMMDFVEDLETCEKLGLKFKGKKRETIKAEILSTLTGKPVEMMLNFFKATTSQDAKKDLAYIKQLGLTPTGNRRLNKAMIVNALIEMKKVA